MPIRKPTAWRLIVRDPPSACEAALQCPFHILAADRKCHQREEYWQLSYKAPISGMGGGPCGVVYIGEKHSGPGLIRSLDCQSQLLPRVRKERTVIVLPIKVQASPRLFITRIGSISFQDPEPLAVIDREGLVRLSSRR